jgi:capsular exopolysaccharide synthesis family protein
MVRGYYSQEVEAGITLRDYWDIILKRRWWVLGFCLALTIITILVCVLMTPIYKSSTIIQIVKDNPGGLMGNTNPLSALTGDTYDTYFYETQFNILKSREVAGRIIRNLKLDTLPEFAELKKRTLVDRILMREEKSPEEIESDMIDLFQDKLVIDPVRNSYLVTIAYKSSDKNMSKKVADAMVNEFNNFNMETRNKSFGTVREWLQKELKQLANVVDESQKKLNTYGQAANIYPPEDKDNVIVQKFVELGSLLTKAQSEVSVKKALHTQIKEKGADAPVVINNPLVLNLRQELVNTEAKGAGMTKVFGGDYPEMASHNAKVRDLRARLNAEVERIRVSVRADYEAAVRAEELLREAFETQKKQVAQFQDNSVQYRILKRDVDSYDGLYQALLSRMKDASVAATMVSSNVSVIETGNFPFKPWVPRNLLFISLAMVVGLIGGVGLAFVVEYFDNSIKTTQEMERVCMLPSLGVVPSLKTGGVHDRLKEAEGHVPAALMTYKDPKSFISEAIQQVRTSLMLSKSGGPPKAVLVASPNPSEGKTTVAVNLAFSLALQGRKVVMIDGDLRKPQIHSVFQQSQQPGLTNFITGSASKEEVLRSSEIETLYWIPAGVVPPNPIDLLTSPVFMDLLEELRGEFDHVIIDTPPILGFADGRNLATLVDGVILVIKHHSTSREAGKMASQLLKQINAPIIGVVLNHVQAFKLGYGRYYGYMKYYDKYYNKKESTPIDG